MEYALWILAIAAGFVLGRFIASQDTTSEEESCNFLKAQLEKDVVYYKKLTKTLVDENTELRHKLNERT